MESAAESKQLPEGQRQHGKDAPSAPAQEKTADLTSGARKPAVQSIRDVHDLTADELAFLSASPRRTHKSQSEHIAGPCSLPQLLAVYFALTALAMTATHYVVTAPAAIMYVGHRVKVNGSAPGLLRRMPAAIEFFEEFVLPRKPVLLRFGGNLDATFGWHTQEWTNNYLRELVGDDTGVVVEVMNTGGEGALFGRGHSSNVEVAWGAYLDNLEKEIYPDAPRYYLNLQEPDSGARPEAQEMCTNPPLSYMTHDFGVPSFLLSMPIRHINLWMGRSSPSAGSKSRMHFDGDDNLYVLLRGRKRVKLFAPSDALKLDTYGEVISVMPNGVIDCYDVANDPVGLPHFSKIDTESVDFALHPRYREAKQYKVDMRPGDMLFIPAGWFHEVKSFGSHMALNFWSLPPDEAFQLWAEEQGIEYDSADWRNQAKAYLAVFLEQGGGLLRRVRSIISGRTSGDVV